MSSYSWTDDNGKKYSMGVGVWSDPYLSKGAWTRKWFELGSDGNVVVHRLVAPPGVTTVDADHVHFKHYWNPNTGAEWGTVTCAVKNEGVRKFSRREMVEAINRATGLNLSWQF